MGQDLQVSPGRHSPVSPGNKQCRIGNVQIPDDNTGYRDTHHFTAQNGSAEEARRPEPVLGPSGAGKDWGTRRARPLSSLFNQYCSTSLPMSCSHLLEGYMIISGGIHLLARLSTLCHFPDGRLATEVRENGSDGQGSALTK